MAGPFVISMKFEADGSGVRSTTGAIRQDLGGVREVLNAAGAGAANLNEKAAGAAMSLQRLADQQQRMQAISATGIDKSFGIGGGADSSTRAADIAAYGDELDRLRARFNPLYAAIKQYRQEVGQIREAHRLGAISSDEMTAAIGRERTATLASIATLKQRGQAVAEVAATSRTAARSAGAGSFNTANIAAQFQDIGVTSAMGMSPLQIALQQGTQLSAVFEQLKANGQGVGSTLASAFASIISPMSLITIGAVAAGAAVLQWGFNAVTASEDASDALEEHAKWLDQILFGYDEAAAAAKQAGDEARKLPQGVVASDLGQKLKDQEVSASKVREQIDAMYASLEAYRERLSLTDNGLFPAFMVEGPDFTGITSAIERLQNLSLSASSSRTELDAAATAARELANSSDDPAVKALADDVFALVTQLRAAQGEAYMTAAALASLNNQALLTNVSKGADTAFSAIERLRALAPDLRTEYEQAGDILREALGSGADSIILAAAREEYQQTIAALDEQAARQEAERAARVAESEAKKQSAYDQTRGSVAKRLEQMRLETSLIGQSTFASERARIVLELENAAREDAIGLTTGRAAAIQQEADAYAFAAIAREQMTEREREGREEFEFYQGTFRSFFTSFFSDIARGENAWDSFANAASGALDRVADRALGMAADGIFDLIFGAITGGLTGGLGGGGNGFIPTLTGPSLGSFDTGGWTGGTRGQVRGLVHGEEFVVKAGPAAANRAMLEQLNAGGSIGGVQLTYAPSYVVQGNADERVMERAAQRAKEEFWAEFPVRYADAVRRGKVG